MQAGQRLADGCAVRDRRAARPHAVEKAGDRRRLAGERPQRIAVAAVDRLRAGDAARGEMIHQAEEEGEIPRIDALLVERDDVLALRRGQEEVGVLDALGDPLEGIGLADVVFGEKGFELGVADFRVDRHVRPPARAAA